MNTGARARARARAREVQQDMKSSVPPSVM